MKRLILTFTAASLITGFSGCSLNGNSNDLVKENFSFAAEQFEYAFVEIDKAKAQESQQSIEKRTKRGQGELVSPRTFENDQLTLVVSGDWTSGFFPGELWYMYEYTKDPKWENAAKEFTAPLEREKNNGGTHDMGFKVYCSFGNGYRLTHDKQYKDILLEAARTLTTRYKPNAKIIRSWDHNQDKWQSPVIIDNMMNLELLFWAWKESGDSTFYQIAVNHAETTMKNHFREDYSCYHVIDYDTLSGNVLKHNTHQGYAHESTWARGEAWALYGYSMCYRETGKIEFLQQAQNVADFIFNNPNLPADLIPYWDYDAPNIPNEPRDVSAATITASALYELSGFGTEKSDLYRERANTIIENLSKHYRVKKGEKGGFLLDHSTGHKPKNSEVDVPIAYADYYYLEALLRKQNIENQNKDK